ncbi:3-keto-disaccharide hydrolase [Aquirufa sp. A-Brett2-15D]
MKYIFLLLLFSSTLLAQDPSRVEQNRLRILAQKGKFNTLKSAAYALKGVYDPTQVTESFILAIAKNRAELVAYLAIGLTENAEMKTLSHLDAAVWLQQYAKSRPQVSAFILRNYLSAPRDLIALKSAAKTWDANHARAFVKAVGTYKASWAISAMPIGFSSEKALAILQSEGIKGLDVVWNMLALEKETNLEIADFCTSLKANDFFRKAVATYDNLSLAQKTVILVYGSTRQWPEVKPLVWQSVQSNLPTRAAAFYALPYWVSVTDFDIIAGKLSDATLASEVKSLQQAMTAITKQDGTLNSKITAFALKASHKENWIPFVQELENMTWLYAEAKKTKIEEAVRAYARINAKLFKNVDQQVLNYRNALDLTTNLETREQIFKGLAKCNSLSAMRTLYLGLQDPNVRQVAADGLASLYLANPNLRGQMTKDWVQEGYGQISEPAVREKINEAFKISDRGFYSMYNGADLRGWKGLVANPVKRRLLSADTLALLQVKADKIMNAGWEAKGEELHFTGHGDNLCSVKDYQDFEMYVDWKIEKAGDAGIYLRGSPQVQIWDISLTKVGAQVGSGGLYNNQINSKNPLKVADNPIDEWNTFRILMKGERVTVYLNGELVVDNVLLENFWDRKIPIFVKDAIELQAHGNHIVYRNIYVKELKAEPIYVAPEADFTALFDGSSLFNWTGNTTDYFPLNGELVIDPKRGGKGNLYTKKEYGDFHLKLDFQLTPGANNGIGIRAPLEGDAAYLGMELQIMDNSAPVYAKLQPYQYHGSVYGIIPAKLGFLKPLGEWNEQEVIAQGNKIKVILNGEVIVDGDIALATKEGTADHRDHPGLLNKMGHIGFLGHGSPLKFRNLRIKELIKKK